MPSIEGSGIHMLTESSNTTPSTLEASVSDASTDEVVLESDVSWSTSSTSRDVKVSTINQTRLIMKNLNCISLH